MPTAAIAAIASDDIPAAVEAINAHRYSPAYEALPDRLKELLDSARAEVSPVAKIARTAEIIYAWRGQVDNDTRGLGVQMASFAADHHWWGLGTGRGFRMSQALRKDRSESVSGYDAANDPAPLQEYGPPAEEPPAPPPSE